MNRQAPTSGPIIAPPCSSPTRTRTDDLAPIGELRRLGFKVATQVEPAEVFGPPRIITKIITEDGQGALLPQLHATLKGDVSPRPLTRRWGHGKVAA